MVKLSGTDNGVHPFFLDPEFGGIQKTFCDFRIVNTFIESEETLFDTEMQIVISIDVGAYSPRTSPVFISQIEFRFSEFIEFMSFFVQHPSDIILYRRNPVRIIGVDFPRKINEIPDGFF